MQNQKDLVDYLYTNTLGGLLITAIAFFSVVNVFSSSAPAQLISVLNLSMGSLLLLRLVDYLYWRRNTIISEESAAYKLRFQSLTVLTGIAWAAGACSLFPYQEQEARFFTLLVLGSMTGGAVVVLSGSRFLTTFYTSCLLMPISVTALLQEDGTFKIIGILGIAYWLTMLTTGRLASRVTVDAVVLKNKEHELRAQIQKEKDDLSAAYAEIKETNFLLDHAKADLESKVMQRTEEIYRLSNRDPLTGLLNRAAFSTQLHALLDRTPSQPLAVWFIDLTGFKAINDALGHHVGDQVLCIVAERLERFFSGAVTCRWGGDEFVLATPCEQESETLRRANQFLLDLKQPVDVGSSRLSIGGSVGVALYPEHSQNPDTLVRQADLAMYRNKQEYGTGMLLYNESFQQEFLREQRLITALNSALLKQQMHLVFQPIISVKQDLPIGAEALLRWTLDDEDIRPDVFIPLAEKSGAIIEIGAWVLNRACEIASKWTFADNAHISINVSAIQLSSDGFFDTVRMALIRSGIAPERVRLEITESTLIGDNEKISAVINKLLGLKVSISIDDFGTGYSNFNQLKTVSAQVLKIDQGFIREIDNDDTIIRAVLLMAREYGFRVVAEGVETVEQLNALKRLGVDDIQGYYFSPPLIARELEQWWPVRETERLSG